MRTHPLLVVAAAVAVTALPYPFPRPHVDGDGDEMPSPQTGADALATPVAQPPYPIAKINAYAPNPTNPTNPLPPYPTNSPLAYANANALPPYPTNANPAYPKGTSTSAASAGMAGPNNGTLSVKYAHPVALADVVAPQPSAGMGTGMPTTLAKGGVVTGYAPGASGGTHDYGVESVGSGHAGTGGMYRRNIWHSIGCWFKKGTLDHCPGQP